jgi:hypothetical protein
MIALAQLGVEVFSISARARPANRLPAQPPRSTDAPVASVAAPPDRLVAANPRRTKPMAEPKTKKIKRFIALQIRDTGHRTTAGSQATCLRNRFFPASSARRCMICPSTRGGYHLACVISYRGWRPV